MSGPGVGSDTLTSVEQVQGSNFADTLVATGFGTGSPNAASVLPNGVSAGALFEGMGGNDNISGSNVGVSYQSATAAVNVTFTAPGVGTATGDSSVGTDTFTSGVNFIRGSSFNDTIVGSSAGEQFYGGSGNDLINGGGGVDRARYSAFVDDVTGGVTIDLAVGTVVGDASVGSDTLQSIESIRGSNFADSFNATSFSGLSTNAGSSGTFNEFEGMGGNDTITGNGNTQIAFFNATAAVTVDLVAGTASGDASVG